MKAAEEGSTSEAANTPVKVAPVRKPVLELKRPVTREDVPQMQSAANLLKGTLTGEFSERQLQCLAKDPRVGPLYKTAMVRDMVTTTYNENMQPARQLF